MKDDDVVLVRKGSNRASKLSCRVVNFPDLKFTVSTFATIWCSLIAIFISFDFFLSFSLIASSWFEVANHAGTVQTIIKSLLSCFMDGALNHLQCLTPMISEIHSIPYSSLICSRLEGWFSRNIARGFDSFFIFSPLHWNLKLRQVTVEEDISNKSCFMPFDFDNVRSTVLDLVRLLNWKLSCNLSRICTTKFYDRNN